MPEKKYKLRELIDSRKYKALERFVRANSIIDDEYTDYDAVVYACSEHNPQALGVLLRAGARVQNDREPQYLYSAMYYALLNSSLFGPEIVEALMDHGYSFRSLELKKASPAATIFARTEIPDEVVELVLSAYIAEQCNPADEDGVAPSHVACLRRDIKSLEQFLQFDPDCVNLQIRRKYDDIPAGVYPLHLAVMLDRHDKAELLLKNNADVLALDYSSRTPLHVSAYYQTARMARLLFKHFDSTVDCKNPIDDAGLSVFHVACWMGPAEVVERYLNTSMDIVNKAVEAMEEECYNLAYRGYTPLHFAVMSGDAAKVELLIKRGAKISVESQTDKVTPLGLAVKRDHKAVISLLTRTLCLREIYSVGHDSGFEVLHRELFEMRDNPIFGDWKTYAPLHFAVARRDVQLTENLLQSGVDVNARNDRGMTPLMMAYIPSRSMARLWNEIDPYSIDEAETCKIIDWFLSDDSPQSRVVELLLKYKADVNAVDNDGRTALSYLSTTASFLRLHVVTTETERKDLATCHLRYVEQLLFRGAELEYLWALEEMC